jgi:hypothetical protein
MLTIICLAALNTLITVRICCGYHQQVQEMIQVNDGCSLTEKRSL